jgi:hypothetical protein
MSNVDLYVLGDDVYEVVIPDFYAKIKYSSYVYPGSIVPHTWIKVLTDNQMS